MARSKQEDEQVELTHHVKDGILVIDGTVYEIADNKVLVSTEHVNEAKKHIAMGG